MSAHASGHDLPDGPQDRPMDAPSTDSGGALPPGSLLDDRYRVVRTVAEGGMSIVYEVEDRRLPGRLALKQMREWIGDPALRAAVDSQFEREASLLSTLSHVNLPKVTDHFISDGRRCLVEELVDGRTLEELEAESAGPVDEARVTEWAVQICDALEYLHGKGIIYRDLKPSNCMLTHDGVIKLIDFGIVRFFSLGKSRDTVIMGTPGFAAPEQYGRDQTDSRADIFALGVLMHHLLTGHDPCSTPFVYPSPRSLNPRISERVEQIILKAVSLRPEERFPDVAEMRQALRGEVVLLEDVERFVYQDEPPPPRELARQGGMVLGAGATTALVVSGSPVFLSFALCYLPLWLGLLAWDFVSKKHRARSHVEVRRQGITYRSGRRVIDAPWSAVTSLSFASDAMLGIRAARVHTDLGSFAFIVEGNLGRSGALFDVPAIEGATRLCRLIMNGARLVSPAPGSEVFRR